MTKKTGKTPAKAPHKPVAAKNVKPAPKKHPAAAPKKATPVKPAKPSVKPAAEARPSKNTAKSLNNAVVAKKTPAGSPGSAARKPLTAAQLQHFKKKLLEEKTRVLEEVNELQASSLNQSIADQAGELSRYSYHLGDTASLAYDREFSMGLLERQQKYLEQIDEALQRIADGVYGICKVTGEPISIERLEEVPVAKYSVRGKEQLNRQKRSSGGI
jgi:DnaK suppressor protein